MDEFEKIYDRPWDENGLSLNERLREREIDLLKSLETLFNKTNISSPIDLIDLTCEMKESFDSVFSSIKNTVDNVRTVLTNVTTKEALSEEGYNSYTFYTVDDDKVCNRCGGLHGKIFSINDFDMGKTAPPIHFFCRCYVVGIDDELAEIVSEDDGKRTVEFRGKDVTQDDSLFDPNYKDEKGQTNIERMEKGLAPKSNDGKSIEIHHVDQTNDSPLKEMTQAEHQQSGMHQNKGQLPSQINRREFNQWRTEYWKWRANNFK